MRALVSSGLCLAALALPFAAVTPAQAADPLRGTEWFISAPGVTADLNASFTIKADNTLTVDSSCNQVFSNGTVRAGSATIDFPSLGSTRMYCEGAAGSIENALVKSLNSAFYYRITDGKLVLTDLSGNQTTFTSKPVASQGSMTDVVWKLKSDKVAADVAARASFQVKSDGTFGVNSTCNRVFVQGPAVVDGNKVTFPTFGSTMMGCDGDAGMAENILFKSLQGTSTWSVSGDVLTLTAADGTVTTYVR